MGFWLFITVMDLIIPVFMIGLGILFVKRPPVKVNHWYGYRTRMSMKNRDTWDFAHRYAGKIWLITGWIILLVTIPVMLMFLGKDPETVGIAGAIVCIVQSILMAGVIVPTEMALRKKFDKDGNRKET